MCPHQGLEIVKHEEEFCKRPVLLRLKLIGLLVRKLWLVFLRRLGGHDKDQVLTKKPDSLRSFLASTTPLQRSLMISPSPKLGVVDGPDTSESTDGILYPRSPPPEENRGRTRARRPPTPNIEGYHTFTAMNRKFIVEKRWKFVREMGVGAFGAVVYVAVSPSGSLWAES